MKVRIEDMEKELDLKMKEIELLKSTFGQDITPIDFKVIIHDLDEEHNKQLIQEKDVIIIQLEQEIIKLRELKENSEKTQNELTRQLALQYDAMKQLENDSKNSLIQLNTETEKINLLVKEKEQTIDRLENANRDLEVKYAKILSEKKSNEDKQKQNETSMDYLQEKIENHKKTESEMREEIEILINQCKALQAQLKEREAQLNKQEGTLEQLDVILQQKDAENNKKEAFISKLIKQIEEKKNQLHGAHLKIRQISKTLAEETNVKLIEKDKELALMKEMIKGHHFEMQTKTKDIQRLKKTLKRFKKAMEMKTQFITTFANKENEEQAKELAKMEQFEIEEVENEEDNEETEVEAKKIEPISVTSNAPSVQSILPEITPKQRKGKIKSEIPQVLQEKYTKKLDEYLKNLEDRSMHNNSSTMKGLLAQNYSEIVEMTHEKDDQTISEVNSVAQDVSDIIKKSLAKNAAGAYTGKASRSKAMSIKVMNEPTYLSPPIIRKKVTHKPLNT